MASRPNPNLSLGYHLGFSRYFTATVVDEWRERFAEARALTVDDLLDAADPSFRYHVIRAAGAGIRRYERSAFRLNARVAKWLDYFVDSRRALPTHDGHDDAYLVRTPAGYRLVRAPDLEDVA